MSNPIVIRPDKDVAAAPQQMAARWLSYLHTDALSEEDKLAFRVWLRTSQENLQAFSHIQQHWDQLASIDRIEELHDASSDNAKWSWGQLNKWLKAKFWHASRQPYLAYSLGALLLAFSYGFYQIVAPQQIQSYTTLPGQQQQISLADGSHLYLSGGTHLTANITRKSRHVNLIRGQVFFDVSPDERRPFVIENHNATVKVLGTKFELKTLASDLLIYVEKGAVQVSLDSAQVSSVVLQAQQEVRVHANQQIGNVRSFDSEQHFAWRQGRFKYDNAELQEVVEDLNRHTNLQFVFLDEKAKHYLLTTAFDVANTAQVLEGLEYSLPVTLKVQGQSVLIRSSQ